MHVLIVENNGNQYILPVATLSAVCFQAGTAWAARIMSPGLEPFIAKEPALVIIELIERASFSASEGEGGILSIDNISDSELDLLRDGSNSPKEVL